MLYNRFIVSLVPYLTLVRNNRLMLKEVNVTIIMQIITANIDCCIYIALLLYYIETKHV